MLALLAMPAGALAARGETLLISRASGATGSGADDVSRSPSTSADGRFVAFESAADNLSGGANGTVTNIFVRDAVSSTTTLASITHDNAAGANGHAISPSISANGRFVAFESDADNLSPADENDEQNVYVRDLVANTTILVSQNNDGEGADDDSHSPSISADGRYVAFRSAADNLSGGANGTVVNIFVRDTVAGTTTLASVTPDNAAGANGESDSPSISANGRYVAFRSLAHNLSPIDDDSVFDVFVRDLQSSTTTLASQANGSGGDAPSNNPSISADGRFVAFDSGADDLSTGDSDTHDDVFLRDLTANTTTLVSQASSVGGDGHSREPSISGDGRFVGFGSVADNLSNADNNSVVNVFVRDVTDDTTTLVSLNSFGGAADADSERPSISADGRFTSFESLANNLTLEDNDAFQNVFRRDVRGGPPRCSNVVQAVASETPTTIALPCADDEGDPISRAIDSGPAHGLLTAVDQGAGTVTYIPARGYSGPDSFSFRASDASGASEPATVSLTIVGAGGSTAVAGLLPGRCANPLRGSRRHEVLNGTSAGDRITGLGGNDRLNGRGGHDCLAGGSGNDRVSGGTGNDRLGGDPGNDRLSGGSGNDRLTGGSGRDSFDAGAGRDTVTSADGRRERVRCGPGRDTVKADRADRLSGCERVKRV